MEPPPHPQMFEDAEHLKLLSIFYYVSAGLAVLGSFFAALYVFFGGVMVSGAFFSASSGPPPPQWMGWMFIVIGVVMTLGIWAYAFALYLAGRWLAERRNRTFCLVMAGISCISFPLGTALGVFTIIVLQRPSVRALFDRPLLAGAYLDR